MMKFKTIVLSGAGIGGTVATHVRVKKAGPGRVIHPVPGVNVRLFRRT